MFSTRSEKLLLNGDKGRIIIEIGPSFAPIAPKKDGWKSWIVDHLPREGLIEKYTGHDSRIDQIEPVDTVWAGGFLHDAVPADRHGSFDLLIASHVIEHMPDPIAFLQSAATLLTADGRVSLAIPDKRYCFDFYKPLTMSGDLLHAHSNRAERHDARTIFNYLAYSVKSEGQIIWGQAPVGPFEFAHDLNIASSMFRSVSEPDHEYIDAHAWHFTPSSFKLLILELGELDLIDWQVEQEYPSQGCEFMMILKRGVHAFTSSIDRDAARLACLDALLDEAEEQIQFAKQGRNRN